MSEMYDTYKVTIEQVRSCIGPETRCPVKVITTGGDYMGYVAQLLLDFLIDGKLPELQCSADYVRELKTSSDLTMTDEMACILGEYVDYSQKNYEKLVSKLTDFRDKHNLIVVAGELKRG